MEERVLTSIEIPQRNVYHYVSCTVDVIFTHVIGMKRSPYIFFLKHGPNSMLIYLFVFSDGPFTGF